MTFCYSCMNQLQAPSEVCPHCKSKIPYIPLHKEDLQPGTRLNDGRFIIGRALGHGGYGITYIAYDTKMLVKRTIKEYFPKGAHRDDQLVPVYPESEEANVARTREHFLHEARMMIRASEGHIPGIVQGIDTFKENGTSYILMEYLEGYTLDDYMHQVLYGPFQWDAAVRYVAEALVALQKLHEKNILHRDISCNNIFLCTDNTIRLIDFGSSEPLDRAQTDPGSLWKSRKPAYTPREQAENRKQGTYSDVYAMGVVLFKMITGNVDRNLNGKMLPSVRSAANNQEIPQALDRILMEATVEDPEKRIQTADEFRRKLLPLIGEKEKKGRRTGLIAILAALVLVLGVAVFIILSGGSGTDDQWAVISIDTNEDNFSRRYGEIFEINGMAEPDQEVSLVIQKDGSEETLTVDSVRTDSKGIWTLSFNTDQADVDLNKTDRYVVFAAYADENHTNRSGRIGLTIDRSLTPLVIGIQGTGSKVLDVDVGEKVTIVVQGQENQNVIVNVADRNSAATLTSRSAAWQDGEWTCELDMSEFKPDQDSLSREIIVSAYYDQFRYETQTEGNNTVKLTVHRSLQPITIAFEGDKDTITATRGDQEIRVYGTAEANESLVLRIGPSERRNPKVDEKGHWEMTLPKVEDLQDYQPDIKKEIKIYASYSRYTQTTTSEVITLISNVQRGKSDIYPVIETVPAQVNEGDDIVLSGTAEPGADLKFSIVKNGTEKNLADDVTARADDETGKWSLTINTSQIREERREGSSTRYAIVAHHQTETKELTSNTVSLNIFRPVTYDTPVIRFTEHEESEISLNYAEPLALSGTAKAGEHMRLLINGDAMQADIDVKKDGTWSYSFPNLNTWKPALNKETKLTFQIQYASTDMTDKKPVVVNVTNKQFAALSASFENEKTEVMIGPSGQAVLTVKGDPGRKIDLLRNGIVWKNGTLDGKGILTVLMTAEDIPYGSENAEMQARYSQQTENLSNKAVLQADQRAEPIRINGTVTEETAEISGTAEPQAILTLTIDGKETAKIQAGKDGAFSFTKLSLSAGSKIEITETDLYGNTTVWNTAAAELIRANITLEGHTNGEFLTYGPNNRELTLSGTAAKNKPIQITVAYPSANNKPIKVTADQAGKWKTSLTLPLEDKLQATVAVQYEDGRGSNILLYALCDNSIAPPEIQPGEIYERTPDAVTCTVGEANCRLTWQLLSSKGRVKNRGTAAIDSMQSEIKLPADRAAGDVLTVKVTDTYGNEASASVTILEQRDEISGVISSVVCGDDYTDVHNGGEFTGTLRIEAYVAAGSDASPGTPALQLVQNGNTMEATRLVQTATPEELQRVTRELSGHQADQGWRIKNGELSVSGIEPGGCELRLTAGDTILESWKLTYIQPSEQGGAMHYEDDADGYDAGVDMPDKAFNPRGIYITGWLYLYYEDTEKSINSAQLTLYEDAACNIKVTALNSKKMDRRKRRPDTTKAGSTAYSLGDGAYQKAGWIVTFQSGKISSGQYWATVDAGGMTFGPFRLNIDNETKQIKAKDFIDSLTWNTEE